MPESEKRPNPEGPTAPADRRETEEGRTQAEDQDGSLKVHGDKLEKLIPTNPEGSTDRE